MARLIDADRLAAFPHEPTSGTKDAITEWIEEIFSTEEIIDHKEDLEKLCWKVINGFIGVIETESTVDAVEVVHGEWIGLISEDFVCAEGFNTGMTEKQKGKCLEDFYHRTHCSICNCCFDDRDVKNWNYCPNCGSKIDGGRKDEM